ncbi:hypothetical protein F4780DRAFT_775361 [Xylariomycetidae sp. FL0641]|nr:hypothetical protein F4780DRAFT_775361 [Xylariomycetidae sp. FL0641]
MGYLLYSLTLAVLVTGTVLYLTRASWLPALQERLPFLASSRRPWYARLPGGSFAEDAEAGLSSAAFDLSGNLAGGDGRAGLDDAAKTEILKIMKKRRLPFDEARRVYTEQRFSANGIGADGRPRDPKFVSFS